MKKLLFSLIGILCSMSMWAETVSYVAATAQPSGVAADANKIENLTGIKLTYGSSQWKVNDDTRTVSSRDYTKNISAASNGTLTTSNGVSTLTVGALTFEPTYAGSLDIDVIINSDKAFYVVEDGSIISNFTLSNGSTTYYYNVSDHKVYSEDTYTNKVKVYGTVSLSVKSGSTYQICVTGSKLGFYGFSYTYTIDENTPSFTTDLSSAYSTDTKTNLPLSVVAAHQTQLKWYEASSTTADPAKDAELGTGASCNFSKSTAGTYYVYCRAYNGNATGEKYANSTVATITVTEAPKNTETALTNLVLDNGCNTAIVGTAITGYYMQGAATPGVKSITLSDGATYAINGNTLTVTAEDGTTTQNYTYTLTAVEPLTSTAVQQIGSETSWVKMGDGWKPTKSSYEILKNENTVGGTQRITEGKNRVYLFVGPCDAVVLTNTSSSMSSDRANSTYAVNGAAAVTVTLPKSTGTITIPCNPSQNNMIEIVNKGTGSWGFDKVDMVTKAEFDVNNTLFYGKAKNSVTLTVTNAVKTADITSEYADITGGTMQAYNGHASNDAAMVVNGQFNLNASGACYFHVHLDNALKVGDVIYSENGDNLLVTEYIVETTSSKGSDKYLFPYEVTAGSKLDGATELYIWKTTVGTFTGIKVVGDKVITPAIVGTAEKAFATYCGSQNFTATAGTIFKGSVSNDAVALTCVNLTGDEIVPASEGVIIATDGSTSVTIANTTATATADMTGNELHGTTSRITTPANCMALNADEGEFQSYTGAYFPANKAYLVNAASAKNMRVVFGNATGIKTVNAEATANKAVKRIMNGQLVIEKAGKMFNAAGAEMK